MTERQSSGPKQDMREFRSTLNKLMVAHDVFTWKALRDRLTEVGYDIGQSKLSQYLNGKRNPEEPQELFEALAKALRLSENEKLRLVYAFAYPKSSASSPLHISAESLNKARSFEEDMIAEKRSEAEGEGSDEGENSGI